MNVYKQCGRTMLYMNLSRYVRARWTNVVELWRQWCIAYRISTRDRIFFAGWMAVIGLIYWITAIISRDVEGEGVTWGQVARAGGSALVSLFITVVAQGLVILGGFYLGGKEAFFDRAGAAIGVGRLPRVLPYHYSRVNKILEADICIATYHDSLAAIESYRDARDTCGYMPWLTSLRVRRWDRRAAEAERQLDIWKSSRLETELAEALRSMSGQRNDETMTLAVLYGWTEDRAASLFLERYGLSGDDLWTTLVYAPAWQIDVVEEVLNTGRGQKERVADVDLARRAGDLWDPTWGGFLHDIPRCVAAAERLRRGSRITRRRVP